MTTRALSRLSRFGLILLALICLSACGKNGPFSPEARRQSAQWDSYMETLKAAQVIDDSFSWKTLSSALIVRALPYSPTVAGAAEARFSGDPTFTKEVSTWGRTSASQPGAPVVVLMGIFTQDKGEKDVTELGRFRPRLIAEDGRSLAPLAIKRYGRDSLFIRDHFPNFNPWEQVYMVKFPAPSRGWQSGQATFELQWPGGSQRLDLMMN